MKDWKRWLDELAEIDCESPIWDTAQAFIASVEAIAELKREARNEPGRQAAERWAAIEAEFGEVLEVTCDHQAGKLNLLACKKTELAPFLERATYLEQVLGAARESEHKLRDAGSYRKGSQIRKELGEAEAKVLEAYGRLRQLLHGGSDLSSIEPPPEPLPNGEAPVVAAPAAPSAAETALPEPPPPPAVPAMAIQPPDGQNGQEERQPETPSEALTPPSHQEPEPDAQAEQLEPPPVTVTEPAVTPPVPPPQPPPPPAKPPVTAAPAPQTKPPAAPAPPRPGSLLVDEAQLDKTFAETDWELTTSRYLMSALTDADAWSKAHWIAGSCERAGRPLSVLTDYRSALAWSWDQIRDGREASMPAWMRDQIAGSSIWNRLSVALPPVLFAANQAVTYADLEEIYHEPQRAKLGALAGEVVRTALEMARLGQTLDRELVAEGDTGELAKAAKKLLEELPNRNPSGEHPPGRSTYRRIIREGLNQLLDAPANDRQKDAASVRKLAEKWIDPFRIIQDAYKLENPGHGQFVGDYYRQVEEYCRSAGTLALEWCDAAAGMNPEGRTRQRLLHKALQAARQSEVTKADMAIWQITIRLLLDWFDATASPPLTVSDRPLLLVPEIGRDEKGAPRDASGRLAAALVMADNNKRTLDEAFRLWLDSKKDLRWADAIVKLTKRTDHASDLTDREYGYRAELKESLGAARDTIEAAYFENRISRESDRAERLALLELVWPGGKNTSSGRDRILVDFAQAEREIDAILEGIDKRPEIAPQDAASLPAPAVAEDPVIQFFRQTLSEFLEFIEHHAMEFDGRNAMPRFKTAWSKHHRDAPSEQISVYKVPYDPPGPGLERNQVVAALDAWNETYDKLTTFNPDQIKPLLSFLGMQVNAGHSGSPVRHIERGAGWTLLHAAYHVLADRARPIRHFGKDLTPVPLVMTSPGMSPARLAEVVEQARVHVAPGARASMIVLYQGALTKRHREDVARLFWERDFSCLVLDQALLAFLCLRVSQGNSFRAFLACTAPMSSLMPFTPDTRASVAPEMFFGRKRELADLAAREGKCLVYGGRQLGKSTILNKLLDEYRSPDSAAWMVTASIRSENPIDRLRRAIIDKIRESDPASSPKGVNAGVREHILAFLQSGSAAGSRRQCLLIIDEADDLLDEDRKSDFSFVLELIETMNNTARAFKVILAGNRSVGRFHHLSNQPFLQMGSHAIIGPLPAKDAAALLEQPLAALGFFLESPKVLRDALGLTNYYAVLIHYLGQELILKKRASGLPGPQKITERDVRELWTDVRYQNFAEDIFWGTLDLDASYGFIVASLLLQPRECSPAEILEDGKTRFEALFQDKDVKKIQVLMDELEQLSILVRTDSGSYLLRGSHLERILSRNSSRLQAILDDPEQHSAARIDPKLAHPVFDGPGPRSYGPLPDNIFSLLQKGRGVSLITGSELSGAGQGLIQCFRNYQSDEREIVIVPSEHADPAQFTQYLADAWKRRSGRPSVDFVANVPDLTNKSSLYSWILAGWAAVDDIDRDGVRLHFVFSAAAYRRYLGLAEDRRAVRRRTLQQEVYLRPWTRAAVDVALRQHPRPGALRASDLLETTGGWHLLIDRVLCAPEPIDEFEAVKKELATRDGAVRFLRDAGLHWVEGAYTVLKLVRDEPNEHSWDDLAVWVAEAFPALEDHEAVIRTLENLGYLVRNQQTPPRYALTAPFSGLRAEFFDDAAAAAASRASRSQKA